MIEWPTWRLVDGSLLIPRNLLAFRKKFELQLCWCGHETSSNGKLSAGNISKLQSCHYRGVAAASFNYHNYPLWDGRCEWPVQLFVSHSVSQSASRDQAIGGLIVMIMNGHFASSSGRCWLSFSLQEFKVPVKHQASHTSCARPVSEIREDRQSSARFGSNS